MWNLIKTNDDINELMACFGGFENSCVCSVKYRSGAYVGAVSEHFINDDMSLSVILQRRSRGFVQSFELLFRDIRLLRLEPMSKGMECYLTSATLRFTDTGITFSTWDDFNTVNADSDILLITAASLLWRDVSETVNSTAG